MAGLPCIDGYGLRRLIKNGCPAAIVTAAAGGDSIVLRMQELGINRIHQGVDDKLQTVKNILAEENIAADAAAYMGDDLPDLQAMQYVGLACAPQSAMPRFWRPRIMCRHVRPGAGALRDVCDFILANRRSNL